VKKEEMAIHTKPQQSQNEHHTHSNRSFHNAFSLPVYGREREREREIV